MVNFLKVFLPFWCEIHFFCECLYVVLTKTTSLHNIYIQFQPLYAHAVAFIMFCSMFVTKIQLEEG